MYVQLSRGEGWEHTSTGLTPPHFCACSKPGHGFPASYVVVCFVFSEFSKDKRCLFVLLILVELVIIAVIFDLASKPVQYNVNFLEFIPCLSCWFVAED